jgi:hypothetical protein
MSSPDAARNRRYRWCFFLLAIAATSAAANTSSVFSPDVSDGEWAWEYRMSLQPQQEGAEDVFAHRLHVQHAFDETWRARLLVAQRSIDGASLDTRYARLEVQQQLLEDEVAGWDSALRYELQLADDGGPDRFRLAWTGKWDLDEAWQLRANTLFGREFGAGRDSGIQLAGRAQVTRRTADGVRLGLELFSDFGTTDDLPSYDGQEHQLGPILKAGLGEAWTLNVSYLRGVSDAAPDDNFRVFIEWSP